MAPNLSKFNKTLNATFADLRAQLTNQTNHFVTAQATTGTDLVYAMFQCRNYISELLQICEHSSPTKPTILPPHKQPPQQIMYMLCFNAETTSLTLTVPPVSPPPSPKFTIAPLVSAPSPRAWRCNVEELELQGERREKWSFREKLRVTRKKKKKTVRVFNLK
ncbi:hypothetical protein DEO72_LG10g2425 [Vigna unguiculata]|uniref:Gnk2-homologous domain-containing protein n=1 Tax=Vigna unguiculata TaxID=3917 RepID=A0A4D6NE85_VIGUN|nr:hypothetical protein DEO72_LG10g2425 [Vigna unguiculata]